MTYQKWKKHIDVEFPMCGGWSPQFSCRSLCFWQNLPSCWFIWIHSTCPTLPTAHLGCKLRVFGYIHVSTRCRLLRFPCTLESSWQWKTHSAFHLQTLIPWTSRLSTHVWLPKGESRLSIGEINAPHWPDMSAVLATNFYLAKPIYWLKSKYARLY